MFRQPPPAWSEPFVSRSLEHLVLTRPFDQITHEWAWGDATGAGIKVAVIDSGIDATHEAVGGNVRSYVSVQEGPEGIYYDTSPHTDEHGHATACSGIIRSVAPECELYSVKVLGNDLRGRGLIFASGLRWAIEQGIRVCNLSLGTTKKEFYALLHELVDMAYFNNVILVTAANNFPIPSFPSMYSSVISVASHPGKDPFLYYYNPQPPVEFGAPGINVRVAWHNHKWITATGNSFAAPHITGLITRILSKHPELTPFQAKVVLYALAANVSQEVPRD
jgi:subtilisin family serine protease